MSASAALVLAMGKPRSYRGCECAAEPGASAASTCEQTACDLDRYRRRDDRLRREHCVRTHLYDCENPPPERYTQPPGGKGTRGRTGLAGIASHAPN